MRFFVWQPTSSRWFESHGALAINRPLRLPALLAARPAIDAREDCFQRDGGGAGIDCWRCAAWFQHAVNMKRCISGESLVRPTSFFLILGFFFFFCPIWHLASVSDSPVVARAAPAVSRPISITAVGRKLP